MDSDNACWAMEQLHAATAATTDKQDDGTPANTPSYISNSNTYATANPYSDSATYSHLDSAPSTPFVSQFRIGGEPILPPLMTAEKRRLMQQLRQQAVELEAKYTKQPNAKSKTNLVVASDSSSSSSSTSSNSSSTMSTTIVRQMPKFPQLQQTETFIYDSTCQQPGQEQELSRCLQNSRRPQSLYIEPKKKHEAVPLICVNPPTPQCDNQPPIPPPSPVPSPALASACCKRQLGSPRRRLNNITSRILQFESTWLGKELELKPKPVQLLWQNQDLCCAVDKQRMLRSSTSPALSASQSDDTQRQRSRSFTLEEPSQALVDHMQREGKKMNTPSPRPSTAAPPPPPPPPPPLPPLTATAAAQRCRFDLPNGSSACCTSAQSLEHLRRDTVESKAKQVQRSVSSSCVDVCKSSGRRRGGNTVRLQNQRHQLEQLLQRALHETTDVLEAQDELERQQLTEAKNKMFKDIKSAHRDRFQQLVQYQHEEVRRMQAEFDRQQKFLIEQICTEINVSSYAHENQQISGPGGISEYTSTDDLPTPSRVSPSNTYTQNSLETSPHTFTTVDVFPTQDKTFNTARKRLFPPGNESEEAIDILPMLSTSSSAKSSTISSKVKKPVQRSHSKTPTVRKAAASPMLPAKTPPAKRVTNNKTPSTVSKNNPRNQPQQQQQQQLPKTRHAASPSRPTLPVDEPDIQRRHKAATLLNAATRGFLVRRLFRTEQVQRIVQTIRDTLIFVLNLHLETYGSSLEQEKPSNIRLKARLLQQLCSASRTLHLIFFQTSIKERMEIIARDRKRVKTKRLAMHLKQRQELKTNSF